MINVIMVLYSTRVGINATNERTNDKRTYKKQHTRSNTEYSTSLHFTRALIHAGSTTKKVNCTVLSCQRLCDDGSFVRLFVCCLFVVCLFVRCLRLSHPSIHSSIHGIRPQEGGWLFVASSETGTVLEPRITISQSPGAGPHTTYIHDVVSRQSVSHDVRAWTCVEGACLSVGRWAGGGRRIRCRNQKSGNEEMKSEKRK